MRNFHSFRLPTLLLGWALVSLLVSVPAEAQSFGKIRGTVRDAQTGETLPGANVIIEGTALGAAADENGVYNIIQVPPGTYTIVASFISYHPKTITGVEVKPGLSANIDITLQPQTVQIGELEVVAAEQNMVQQDITHTQRTFTREELEAAPGITSTLDVFKLQGGVVVEGPPQRLELEGGTQIQVRDESLKDIHIRGGRGGEILYLVDGIPITHPIYGGRSVLDLDVSDIESIEVLTGAFNAEYGNAQSGVVKITTRSGRAEYAGGSKYRSDAYEIIGESFDSHNATVYLSGPEPITTELLPRLGLRLPGKVFFYVSGSANLTNTAYNNLRERDRFRVLGLDITGKQSNEASLNGKLTWRASPRIEAILSYNGSVRDWSSYSWLWTRNPDNTATYARDTRSMGLQFRHTISNKTYYDLRLGYLGVDYNASFDGMTPPEFWAFVADSTGRRVPVRTVQEPRRDDLTGFYTDQGFETIWRDDVTGSYSFKGSVISQASSSHLLKAGVEARYHDIRYVDIQNGGTALSPYGQYTFFGDEDDTPVPAPPGPYKEFGRNRWVFSARPIEGAFFLEDKFERNTFIFNAGVRVDWFSPGSSVEDADYKEVWEAATGLAPDWDLFRFRISPRFGVSFPILENSVIFFSYGHFSQLPEIQFFYRDPYSGGFTGNPGLDYVETILYEFGLTHQFTDNWLFDVKTYNKDISKQIGTTQLRANLGLPVSLYDNRGYARARGLEFKLTNRNRYRSHTSGEATYTVQWAKGYNSSAFEDYVNSVNDFPNPIRERRLNWDVRHQVIFQGQLKSPRQNPLRLFGRKLGSEWFLSVLTRFSSGQPYTPGVVDPVEAQRLHNSETGPINMEADIKFNKRFELAGGRVGLFIEAFNVFDQRNVQIGWGFNPWTGLPYTYGDVDSPTNELFTYSEMFRLRDPRQFSLGRRVVFGLQYDF